MAPVGSDQRRGTAARGLAVLALLGLAVVTAPSCTAVLGIDGYGNAASELCDKLDQCYSKATFPDCFPRLDRNVEESDQKVREAFLVDFARSACLSSCVSARSCVDADPLCSHADCSVIEDCCGFSTGVAACQNEHCCATKGASCGGAHDLPCCGGAGECNGGFCGGVPCEKAGESCTSGTQCCSHQCIGGTCSKDTCRPTGFECDTSDNCCGGNVCSVAHRCEKQATCNDVQGACHDASDCCQTSDVVLSCFHPTAGSGVCSTCDSALPEGSECFTDGDCCSDLRCDTVSHTCVPACTPLGITCQDDAQCCSGSCQVKEGGGGLVCVKGCTNGYCTQDDQCCTKTCLPSGVCKLDCEAPGCDHDVCSPGAPLDGSCSSPPVDTACVTAICADDPYCCCQTWDDICVARAAGTGGFTVYKDCSTACN